MCFQQRIGTGSGNVNFSRMVFAFSIVLTSTPTDFCILQHSFYARRKRLEFDPDSRSRLAFFESVET